MKKLLKGKNVRRTAIEHEEIKKVTSWYNDTNFMRHYDVVSAMPKNTKDVESIVYDAQQSQDKEIFAIRHIKTGELIGVTGFENILWNNQNAVIYIGIGEEKFRGQGIGKESLYLTMEFGFEELNFNRIYLTVLEYNKKAINLYESLGFVREGVYREFIIRDGKKYDMYLYGILKSEWTDKFL